MVEATMCGMISARSTSRRNLSQPWPSAAGAISRTLGSFDASSSASSGDTSATPGNGVGSRGVLAG
ncbi:MAG TPA: hypothetical protein VHM25_14430 [Polyangiaceae bacterium]|nr:hypothetical protein [Polyangiaceae bacterium]